MSNYIVIAFVIGSILAPFETKHYTWEAIKIIHNLVKEPKI